MSTRICRRLIVGLGNPGQQYEYTRHNIGFLAVRRLAEKLGIKLQPNRMFNGEVFEGVIELPEEKESSLIFQHVEKRKQQEQQQQKRTPLFDASGRVLPNNNNKQQQQSNSTTGNISQPSADATKKKDIIVNRTVHLHLLLPMTYMNLSGSSVKKYMEVQRFTRPEDELLVVYDDIYTPFGEFKMKLKGGHGGHNGLRDIEARIRTDKYPRLRVGIGVDSTPGNETGKVPLEAFVLQKFSHEERERLPALLDSASNMMRIYMHAGIHKAMNEANSFKL
eukprot:GEZU01020515.1.p1 GENE.GEZU01020515.1~~GEZU01020515.1.p1  ORF type:complete len:278 (+),score=62.28 GEZU01020515.1:533-1366(+)